MKQNNFPKSQNPNFNTNRNKILLNINSLFNPKSQAFKNNNNIIPNPFNIGNNKIKNNDFNQVQFKNIININQSNEEDSLKLNMNMNINNEIVEQKGSRGNNINNNNIEMGQSPIFENEGNSAFIG